MADTLRQQTRERLSKQSVSIRGTPIEARVTPPPLTVPSATTIPSGAMTSALWRSLSDNGYAGSLTDMNRDLSKILNKAETILSGGGTSPSLVNAIQGVVLGDSPATIDEQKNAHIPIAGAFLGLVKSSDKINEISVSEQGVMSVNGLDIKKLIQSKNDILILDNQNSK